VVWSLPACTVLIIILQNPRGLAPHPRVRFATGWHALPAAGIGLGLRGRQRRTTREWGTYTKAAALQPPASRSQRLRF
jgi:hypothetical protein